MELQQGEVSIELNCEQKSLVKRAPEKKAAITRSSFNA